MEKGLFIYYVITPGEGVRERAGGWIIFIFMALGAKKGQIGRVWKWSVVAYVLHERVWSYKMKQNEKL